MKLKYPAEAFALGIILFSAGMRELSRPASW